jgi:hypothetical protein
MRKRRATGHVLMRFNKALQLMHTRSASTPVEQIPFRNSRTRYTPHAQSNGTCRLLAIAALTTLLQDCGSVSLLLSRGCKTVEQPSCRNFKMWLMHHELVRP